MIQKGVIKVICDVKALILTWENFPNKATMPKELQEINVPKKGKGPMSSTFTQREHKIFEEVYVLLYGLSSGWDGKKNLNEIIALFLGGARGTAQIDSHLYNIRKRELIKENKTGIRSMHPCILFANYSLKVFNGSIYQESTAGRKRRETSAKIDTEPSIDDAIMEKVTVKRTMSS